MDEGTYEFKYSVIIPHHETPDLLKRCIESIPERDDIQIIVADDRSRDNDKYLERYSFLHRKNLEYYTTRGGKGGGAARNVGLDHAKGKWLLFADADDYYVEGAFDVIDRELSDEIDILFFNIMLEGSWVERFTSFHKKYEQYSIDGNSLPVRFGLWVPWNKVYSHKIVTDKGIRFDEIPVGNDAMFALNAAKYCERYAIIQDAIYTYTSSNPSSLSLVKMDFNRLMLHTAIQTRINLFYAENGYYRLLLMLLGRRKLQDMVKKYGWKKTYVYARYVKKHFGLGKYMKCRILQKLHVGRRN